MCRFISVLIDGTPNIKGYLLKSDIYICVYLLYIYVRTFIIMYMYVCINIYLYVHVCILYRCIFIYEMEILSIRITLLHFFKLLFSLVTCKLPCGQFSLQTNECRDIIQ